MQDLAVTVIVAVAMVVGVAGTVLPFVPGLWLIWSAGLVYGFVDGFGTGGGIAFTVITALALAGTAAGIVVPQRSATDIGIPWWGQLLAGGLAVVGFFVIPVIGAPIGFAVGIVAAFVLTTGDVATALPASWRIVRSLVVASATQLAAGTLMLLTWIAWVLIA